MSESNLLLERQSQRDEMCGLLNRRAVTDAMVHALRGADERMCAEKRRHLSEPRLP